MRAANPAFTTDRRPSARPMRALRSSRIVASALLCALLGACGQRGPLYFPRLPSTDGGVRSAPSIVQTPLLPSPQSRLQDGAPSTNLAAPMVSLPEGNDSTMPSESEPGPANTPAAGAPDASAQPSGNAASAGAVPLVSPVPTPAGADSPTGAAAPASVPSASAP